MKIAVSARKRRSKPLLRELTLARLLRAQPSMKAVVLSAVPPERRTLLAALAVLDWELDKAGYDSIERFDVHGAKLGYCRGEFDCWLKTPGRCRLHDAEQPIAAAIPGADALVLVSPIAFGGFGSALKGAVDRLICLVSPFFTKRAALTHHEPRYARYPKLHAIGVLPNGDEDQASTFVALNDANALNFMAPARSAAVLDEENTEVWQEKLREMLERTAEPGASIADRDALRRELSEATRPDPSSAPRPPKTAALLVGSAKAPGTSASEHLARAFARRLERAGVECRLHFATEFVHVHDTAVEAAQSLARADLLIPVTPLYVDALPALVTRALEIVERVRRSDKRDARFVPFIQCGFPEPEHTRTAFRIARHFAQAAAYDFGGGLALGGGGVVTPERSLDEARPPVSHVVRALNLAAPALAAGYGVPDAAREALLEPPLPELAYRVISELGFRVEAHRRGIRQRELRAAPLGPPR